VDFLPKSPGGYVLELCLIQPTVLQIGRLGEFTFPAGAYLYFGSACGPGGLSARLSRHLLPPALHAFYWHIDYLRAVAEPRALGYLAGARWDQSAQRLECLWSQAIASIPGNLVPAPGFGASDCHSGCAAHLLFIQKPEAAGAPALLNHGLQNILAEAAGMARAEQDLCWLSIDQSQITTCVGVKTAGT